MEKDPHLIIPDDIIEDFIQASGERGEHFPIQAEEVIHTMATKQRHLHQLCSFTALEIAQRRGDFHGYHRTNVVTYDAINRHLNDRQDLLTVPVKRVEDVYSRSLDIFMDPMWLNSEWTARQLEYPDVLAFRQFTQLLKSHIPRIYTLLETHTTYAKKEGHEHFLPHAYRGVYDVFMSFYKLEDYLKSHT